MIPAFDPGTGALPPGIHESDWAEVAERLGTSDRRRALLAGLRDALKALAVAGCTRVYLGGSFVTAKAEPGDWDGCYENARVDPFRLDKAIARGEWGMMDMLFGGEIYRADAVAFTGETFVAFFQHDRAGEAVGIVALDPATAR